MSSRSSTGRNKIGSTVGARDGTSAAVSVFFNIRSTVFLNKAINRYNEKIAAPEIGFQYDNTQFGNDILGIGLKQRF